MDVAALTSGSTTVADKAASKMAADFDNFLKLLTTQLANQDPLEPLDSNELTAQLVRFTQVEQAISQNKNLEQLVELIHSGQAMAAVGYIGKTVEAQGAKAVLAGGSAKWTYDLAASSVQTTVLVRNAAGVIVYTGAGATGQGKHTFDWNGKDTQGNAQPDGVYQVSVTAKNASGNSMVVTTGIVGKVTGVENVDGETMLAVGKVKVPFDSVIAVTEG